MFPTGTLHSVFTELLGKTNLENLEHAGTVLKKSLVSTTWKVVTWNRRQVKMHSGGNFFKRALNIKPRTAGKKLFDACIQHISTKDNTFNLSEKNLKVLKVKVASAFILSGACTLHKKKNEERIISSHSEVTAKVLSDIDRFYQMPPLKTAYMFLLQKKEMPAGYLNNILIPSLAQHLIAKGITKQASLRIIKQEFQRAGVLEEKHFSLEAMLEIKKRIKERMLMAIKQPLNFSNQREQRGLQYKSTIDHPSLKPPTEDAKYVCDEDDLWMIHQIVEKERTVRFLHDKVNQAVRWVKRNKRIGVVKAVGWSLEVLISGLMTGGIGAAITSFTSIFCTIGVFGLKATICEIRTAYLRSILNKEQSFESFIESCGYLIRKKNVIAILNAFMNLEKATKDVKKQQSCEGVYSSKDLIKREKQNKIIQIRNEQLRKIFMGQTDQDGMHERDNLDEFIVATVTELSRLDDEFSKDMQHLWKPFEAMDHSKVWYIFNKAANSPYVKGKWYKLTSNYHHWLQKSMQQHKAQKSLLNVFDTPPSATYNPYSEHHNWHIENLKILASEVTQTFSSFMLNLGKRISTTLKDLPSWIDSGSLPKLEKILTTPCGPTLSVWAFYYLASKMSMAMNKKLNENAVKNVHEKSSEKRFDEMSAPLGNNEWLALAREAKEDNQQFIRLLKDLRKHHTEIQALLKKAADKKLSEDQRNHAFAIAVLRRNMLRQEINVMLAGAIGHFHEETVKSAWYLNQSCKTLKVA